MVTPKWEQIGTIYVDAGIVMVGDPCYTLPDEGSSRTQIAKSWNAFCDALKNDVSEPFGKGTAIVVSSGYGDGEYPVQIRRAEGRIKELRVKFF